MSQALARHKRERMREGQNGCERKGENVSVEEKGERGKRCREMVLLCRFAKGSEGNWTIEGEERGGGRGG